MMVLSSPPATCDLRALLDPLFALAKAGRGIAAASLGEFHHKNERFTLPRFRFMGPSTGGGEPTHLGLFAGLHGDEPAGCAALVRLLAHLAARPERAAGYTLTVYPVCNPSGYADGTRHSRAGVDLNRCFWRNSNQPEIRILEDELRTFAFDGIITLHADDTCSGLYGYAHGCTLNEALLEPALRASEAIIPRDARESIDGFAAAEGIIRDCFPGVLSAPPEQHPKPFDLIFETPAHAPLELQVEATVLALEKILDEYRGYIAQAENL